MYSSIFPCISPDNSSTAIVSSGSCYSYSMLFRRINSVAYGLLSRHSLTHQQRVAFILPASVDYVACMHGVWRAGGIAVPLNTASSIGELQHYLTTADVSCLVASEDSLEDLRNLASMLNIPLLTVEDIMSDSEMALPVLEPDHRALMLFTSGTTSKPKGVVTTLRNISSQISSLIEAWEWSSSDSIPLFLPLHHIHGIINILSCALASGATVHVFPKFQIPSILRGVVGNEYTVFMAVPTVYVKLVQYLESISSEERITVCNSFQRMRLNVSGSAACPVTLFTKWQELTSQTLLERYGMTEIGMALSNPYNGERRPGMVGQPLPGVQLEIFDETNQPIRTPDTPGEIRIKGENVFLEYWRDVTATEKSFIDGWFCTGDIGIFQDGYYRIMGRSSIDIIKSGGYKLSALEIESVLLSHDDISECAVVGVDDEVWGEAVEAFLVLSNAACMTYDNFKAWCSGKLSSYKIPKKIHVVDSLPRNAMGKVMKSTLKETAKCNV
mmetsp:Transcript_17133/g.25703  ORF Transcript_17133/g.25703 Transcript_17133/m.25703 type:complete len:499 (+) Transcript_17133:45-1541(+)